MTPIRAIATLMLLGAPLCTCAPGAAAAEPIRFEVPVVPGLARHAELLAYPGYLAVALENIGLSPSLSSKMLVGDGGHEVKLRNATLRYTGHKGPVYAYEAGLSVDLGVKKTTLSFPVSVDTSAVPSGRIAVAMRPPLAQLLPKDFLERIRLKTQLVATVAAQEKALAYLDGLAKSSAGEGTRGMFDAILVEAYNKGGGPAAGRAQDVGDAVPLSDQWMLLLTVLIWLAGPAMLVARKLWRIRSRAS